MTEQRWRVTGQSMNGLAEYEISANVQLPQAARELLRQAVIEHVRRTHGVTPQGVPWLLDVRTIRADSVRAGCTDDRKEGRA